MKHTTSHRSQTLLALVLAAGLLGHASDAQAGARLSCKELRELGRDIQTVERRLGVSPLEDIAEDIADENALREMIDELQDLTQVEADSELAKSCRKLLKSWRDLDTPGFLAALARCRVVFDRVLARDCR